MSVHDHAEQVITMREMRIGQLGHGAAAVGERPHVVVVGLTDAVEVAAGYGHSCARRAGGVIVCCGDSGRGELGDGTTSLRRTPVVVLGL